MERRNVATPPRGSVTLPFNESDPNDMLTVELLTDLYVGLEHPISRSSSDGVTTLVIPQTIKRVFAIGAKS